MNPHTPSTVVTARVLAFVQACFNIACTLFFVWVSVLAFQSGRVSDQAGGTTRYITVGFLIAVALALVLLAAATLTVASATRLTRHRRSARTVLIGAEVVSLLFIASMLVFVRPSAGPGIVFAAVYAAPAVAVIAALLSGSARRWVARGLA